MALILVFPAARYTHLSPGFNVTICKQCDLTKALSRKLRKVPVSIVQSSVKVLLTTAFTTFILSAITLI